MKTIRILVLLLLVSVHAFTTASSEDGSVSLTTSQNTSTTVPNSSSNQTTVNPRSPDTATATATVTTTATTNVTTTVTATGTTTGNTTGTSTGSTTGTTTGNTTGTSTGSTTGTTTGNITGTITGNTTGTTTGNITGNTTGTTTGNTTETPAGTRIETPAGATTANGNTTLQTPRAAQSPTLEPTHTSNKSVIVAADATTGKSKLSQNPPQPTRPGSRPAHASKSTPGPDESIIDPTKGSTVSDPENKDSGSGSQTGSDKKDPAKSDSNKKLWWILLPALLVAGALAMVLKMKFNKGHDHTGTLDNGTENASFQSRPESSRDGVMLLGVRSSGGEENAAGK
ncbi:hypothetical protein Q5P01_002771 [Channa striata]|uniref:Uncharacterized protein n=1 Tax=Channa striata TaxID=64152 RepID=A0AA88T6I8_CHASR|nr:hypothetical protein Q5P01_002771 [Channa striata]